jgi:hypothetical protein
MENAELMFVFLMNNQKPKQIEIFKRKWHTYNYIVSRENIAKDKPFIVTREHKNIPNSSKKKLENDILELLKEKMLLIEHKTYSDPDTNERIPRAQFVIPVKYSTDNNTLTQLLDHYLNSFVQEKTKG